MDYSKRNLIITSISNSSSFKYEFQRNSTWFVHSQWSYFIPSIYILKYVPALQHNHVCQCQSHHTYLEHSFSNTSRKWIHNVLIIWIHRIYCTKMLQKVMNLCLYIYIQWGQLHYIILSYVHKVNGTGCINSNCSDITKLWNWFKNHTHMYF